MIRPSRPVQIGAALTGVVGALALAGCSVPSAEAEAPTSAATLAATAPAATGSASGGATAAAGSIYKNGTYTAKGSYATPESVETITVTMTLAGDVVTAVQVVGSPQKQESQQYQSQFIGGISNEVVGRDLGSLSVSRVAGSSLTSGGFNQAVDAIKAEAAA